MVSFKVTDAESAVIAKIADRAQLEIFSPAGVIRDTFEIVMDLSATVAQGCPLRLQELLEADAFNFSHDVGGIYRHIDRQTGKLGNCFRPRFAA